MSTPSGLCGLTWSFVDGKPLALDVQVVHGLSSRLGEDAVAKGENDKKVKYSAACSMIDMNFSPVVWDTLGLRT